MLAPTTEFPMLLRDALIQQAPSLELQRAAANEIAHLDALVKRLTLQHYEAQADIARFQPWREVLIDALVISHIYTAEHDDNPRKALYDLIDWEVKLSRDPAVSRTAAAVRDAIDQAVRALHLRRNAGNPEYDAQAESAIKALLPYASEEPA